MKVRFTGILKQAQTTSIFMFVVLGWIEYKMVFKLTNIDDPMERLKRAIVIVTEKSLMMKERNTCQRKDLK
jgi:hypothetical protein